VYVYICCRELQDRRGLFEKKKNVLLIALLSGDAQQEKEKMAELVAAGRLLRDAVSGRYQLHGQRRYTALQLQVPHLAFRIVALIIELYVCVIIIYQSKTT
jgi:hypothetical protein